MSRTRWNAEWRPCKRRTREGKNCAHRNPFEQAMSGEANAAAVSRRMECGTSFCFFSSIYLQLQQLLCMVSAAHLRRVSRAYTPPQLLKTFSSYGTRRCGGTTQGGGACRHPRLPISVLCALKWPSSRLTNLQHYLGIVQQ